MGKKEAKTNAMRILDRNKISYETISYECSEFIDGLHTAELTNAPVEQSFKTLVVQGKSKNYYALVIPIAEEVDLKQAAKVLGEKSVEMIHVKDILQVTGYVRGGCSPLGMKKQYKTVIHDSARAYDSIYISGGRIGTTIRLNPQDLAKTAAAVFEDVVMKDSRPS
ncbi:Cys-tRNA(Pro) deacylase [Lactonifactor longoviformis]|uniref:Cys-tRNA(Pro) deacylase n=1 Tax=Lactonifactor longoviformis TaxID=341220 RepID=UPI001D023855|nr:Cys-tRNA(Pro) deacylase [Lactonifactor longoviformis]MCB5713161.1 Cys-tRNA(Pro) deacylase [Lactonifactor longoviformis]MCB5717377.1 Cys-tRNA(Pro) deacylase [Lactonifactor longoviformis]